jgi:simple sugar transport system permease protein
MRIPQRHRALLAGIAAFVLLYVGAAARYHDQSFGSPRVLVNLLDSNAALGIVAVGMTFVIISGGIDLSVGAVMALSSMIVGVLIMQWQWHAGAAFAAALVLGTAFGVAMGGMIHVTGIRPFIVTLAGMFLARGLSFLIQLEPIAIESDSHSAFSSAKLPLEPWLGWLRSILAACGLPSDPLPRVPLTACILVATVAAGAYVGRYTRFGRRVYALGGSEEAARLMGVEIGRTKIAVYALSGFCSALAGIVLTLYLSSGSQLEGVGIELDAIAAVVIGGTLLSGGVGSVWGTLVGVLTIGTIVTIITTYEGGFSSGFTKVAIGALLLAFVILQRGLARSRTAHV